MTSAIYYISVGNKYAAYTRTSIDTIRTFGQFKGDIFVFSDRDEDFGFDSINQVIPVPQAKDTASFVLVTLQRVVYGKQLAGKYDKLIYLDGDILAFKPIDSILSFSDKIVLMTEPHALGESPCHKGFLTEEEIISIGRRPAINSGFIVIPKFYQDAFYTGWEKIASQREKYNPDCRPFCVDQASMVATLIRMGDVYDVLPSKWLIMGENVKTNYYKNIKKFSKSNRKEIPSISYTMPVKDVPMFDTDAISKFIDFIHPDDCKINTVWWEGEHKITYGSVLPKADVPTFIYALKDSGDKLSRHIRGISINVHHSKTDANDPCGRWNDSDMDAYQFLALDFDARVATHGYAANDEEIEYARLQMYEAVSHLESSGLNPSIFFSGNGYLVLCPVCIPKNPTNKALLSAIGRSLLDKFDLVDMQPVDDICRSFGVSGTMNMNKIEDKTKGRVYRLREIIRLGDRKPLNEKEFRQWAMKYFEDTYDDGFKMLHFYGSKTGFYEHYRNHIFLHQILSQGKSVEDIKHFPMSYVSDQQKFFMAQKMRAVAGDVVEIGVDWGATTISLARSMPNKTIYGIDNWLPERHEKNPTGNDVFQKRTFVNNLVSRCKNMKIVDKDFYEAANQWEGDIGSIFFDGIRTYEDQMKDFSAWLPKIKTGGWIFVHDAEKPHILKAIEEVSGGKHELHNFSHTEERPYSLAFWKA